MLLILQLCKLPFYCLRKFERIYVLQIIYDYNHPSGINGAFANVCNPEGCTYVSCKCYYFQGQLNEFIVDPKDRLSTHVTYIVTYITYIKADCVI